MARIQIMPNNKSAKNKTKGRQKLYSTVADISTSLHICGVIEILMGERNKLTTNGPGLSFVASQKWQAITYFLRTFTDGNLHCHTHVKRCDENLLSQRTGSITALVQRVW